MGKNVLVLSASPRKGGNSDMLCDRFILGAVENGNNTEKIFLREKKIGYCVACDYCKAHEGLCSQKDDMAEILDKMISADVIVMATPVYFYTMSAQMKTLIDRTDSRYTEIKNKEFYFIMTAAESGETVTDRTLEGFRAFLDCLDGAKEVGSVSGLGVWHKGEIIDNPAMIKAYEMGKSV